MRSCLLSIQPFFTYFFNAALTKKKPTVPAELCHYAGCWKWKWFSCFVIQQAVHWSREQCVTEALTPLNTHDWLTSSSRRQAERSQVHIREQTSPGRTGASFTHACCSAVNLSWTVELALGGLKPKQRSDVTHYKEEEHSQLQPPYTPEHWMNVQESFCLDSNSVCAFFCLFSFVVPHMQIQYMHLHCHKYESFIEMGIFSYISHTNKYVC